MHALPSTLTALVASILTSSPRLASGAVTWRRSNDGNPSSTQYTDAQTNITFMGYATTTGFQFGMALPSTPTTDLIVQLISPLKDGGGWGGVDFGAEMTGYLMVVAWPDTTTSPAQVRISPRIATGYEVSNGANPYTTGNVTLTPISSGTFVNSTHVAATFVCGGCINSDSFATNKATATMSYAYALTPVSSPGEDDTQLSDHTLQGELYGPFDVTLATAESTQYESWAALTTAETATSTASASGSAAPAAATASSSESSSGNTGGSSSSASSSSSTSSSSSGESAESGVQLSTGGIFGMVGLGLVYLLQAVQIL